MVQKPFDYVIMRLIALFSLLVFSFSSCENTGVSQEGLSEFIPIKEKHRLEITLDSTFDFNLIEHLTLVSEDSKSSPPKYFTSTARDVHIWNKLAEGNYSFIINTIFRKVHQVSFSLHSDTVIMLHNELEIEPVSLINKSELLQADSLELVFFSSGCFHHYYEKIYVQKLKSENGRYILSSSHMYIGGELADTGIRIVPSTLIEDILKLQSNSIKQSEEQAKSHVYYSSTTTNTIYLLVAGKLFQFDDRALHEWEEYDLFKARYFRVKEKIIEPTLLDSIMNEKL